MPPLSQPTMNLDFTNSKSHRIAEVQLPPGDRHGEFPNPPGVKWSGTRHCTEVRTPGSAEARQHMETSDDRWWRHAVFYEVYVRSFADSNGDGLGDLHGIRQRLPYLRELGVDALWLTP